MRDAFKAYVRASGLWQRWVLFGPNAPHETARFEVYGITGFGADGRPIVDPEVLHTSAQPDLTDTTQMIGNPPCGWTRGPDAKATYLRGSFAQFHLARAARARQREYVGVQFLCVWRPVHQPGEDPSTIPWTTEVLWAGPVIPREDPA